jgi:hypothetical protein
MSTLAFISVFLKLFQIDRDRLNLTGEKVSKLSTFLIDSKSKNFALLSYLKSLYCDYSFDEIVRSRKKFKDLQKKVFSSKKYF